MHNLLYKPNLQDKKHWIFLRIVLWIDFGYFFELIFLIIIDNLLKKRKNDLLDRVQSELNLKEDDILEIGLNRAVDLIFNHSSKESSKTPSAGRFSKFKQVSKSTAKKAVTKKSPSKTSKTTVKKTKK